MKKNPKYKPLVEKGKEIWKESMKYEDEKEREAFLSGAKFAANLLGGLEE